MISYIYGIIFPLDQIVEICKQKNILIVEDIAESYMGNDYIGDPAAILSIFSFGSIKRYTAFAGALSFIRDPKLYKIMIEVQRKYLVYSKRK